MRSYTTSDPGEWIGDGWRGWVDAAGFIHIEELPPIEQQSGGQGDGTPNPPNHEAPDRRCKHG